MGFFRDLFESDGARQKRWFKEEVAAHAERARQFRAGAKAAGFSETQTEFMARFLSLSNHSHQYYSTTHWYISSPPVDGQFKDREER
jgi:hypothetical protein